MKQPEGSLGTCVGNTHFAASVGPINLLVLVFSFAVVPFSKSAAQMHKWQESHSALECSSKQERFCACVANWVGKSHICNFSFPCNWTTEHHRNAGWKGCLEAPSSMSHSKQVWYQPRPGQPWLWLEDSCKSLRIEATASLGYLYQYHTNLLREFLLILILLRHKFLPFPPFFTICTTKKSLALSPLKLPFRE